MRHDEPHARKLRPQQGYDSLGRLDNASGCVQEDVDGITGHVLNQVRERRNVSVVDRIVRNRYLDEVGEIDNQGALREALNLDDLLAALL